MVLVANPAIQYMLYEQILRAMRRWKQARVAASAAKPAEATTPAATANGPAESKEGGKAKNSKSGAGAGAASSQAAQPPVKLSAGEIFLASALAKIGATIATYWLVVVKSRLQAASKSSTELQYKGGCSTEL